MCDSIIYTSRTLHDSCIGTVRAVPDLSSVIPPADGDHVQAAQHGRFLIDAISQHDYPVVQGVHLLLVSLMLPVTLLVDVTYASLDPASGINNVVGLTARGVIAREGFLCAHSIPIRPRV